MAAYLIRRLWQMIPTLAGVVLLVFFLFKYFGGDPAEILGGLNATPEQIAAICSGVAFRPPRISAGSLPKYLNKKNTSSTTPRSVGTICHRRRKR